MSDDYALYVDNEGLYDVNVTLMLSKNNSLGLEYCASRDFYDVVRHNVAYLINNILELKSLMERLFGVELSVEVKEKDYEVYIEVTD